MGTAEILIVFSALMALIALVTIGIDWIGKPLKHRRFIPRMYRFDDEKLPVDEYGNTNFGQEPVGLLAPPGGQPPYVAPLQQPTPVAAPSPAPLLAPERDRQRATPAGANPTIAVPSQPAPRQVASIDSDIAAAATASRSAFSDSLALPDTDQTALPPTAAASASASATGPSDAMASMPGVSTVSSATGWEPGMPLDTTVDDQKPSLALKAERFWMATAAATGVSHFDDDDISRMAAGKAPRRTNPRTGRAEAMLLTGLRQASLPSDVRMRWPDDSVDPWSAS